jgi:hypothetical protein
MDIRDISVHFFIISPLSFRAENNPDHIHFRNEQVATEFLHIMENTMAVRNDCLSS